MVVPLQMLSHLLSSPMLTYGDLWYVQLEILSQLVNDGNAQLIMREFNAYIKEASRDPVLIAATIQVLYPWVKQVKQGSK